MKVSIVIPNWNGKKQLQENLPFVLAGKPDEVIIVDDKSEDESVEFIKKNYPQIKLFQNHQNKNFAYTVNRGVSQSTGDLICILNADVRPEKNYLKNSFKYFKNPKLFGITLHESGFGPSLSEFKNGFIGYKNGTEKNITQNTFWLSGGSSIIRKEIWNKLSGFDNELFPYYWEDLDLSYRALKRGYKLLWVHDCKVEHRHETFYSQKYSPSKLSIEKETRQLVFIWKNLTARHLFKMHLLGLLQRTINSPGYIKVIFNTLTYLPEIKKKRSIEKREAVVPDKLILEITAGKEAQ